MLFDEKMGGTMHCALGAGPPETGSTNQSAIHWDILKDMKAPGSKIIADGKVIYEEGQYKNIIKVLKSGIFLQRDNIILNYLFLKIITLFYINYLLN